MSRSALLIGVLLAAALFTLALGAYRLEVASRKLSQARNTLASLQNDAYELLSLRADEERIAWRKRPAQDVLARVNRALIEIGLSPAKLSDLREEGDALLPARSGDDRAAWRRQSIRLTLNSLTISELGAYLERWRKTEPLWTISRIELTHLDAADHGPDSIDDRISAYRIAITLTAVYVDDG